MEPELLASTVAELEAVGVAVEVDEPEASVSEYTEPADVPSVLVVEEEVDEVVCAGRVVELGVDCPAVWLVEPVTPVGSVPSTEAMAWSRA